MGQVLGHEQPLRAPLGRREVESDRRGARARVEVGQLVLQGLDLEGHILDG